MAGRKLTKLLFYSGLFFFVLVWLAITVYTFSSLFDPKLAFSKAHFLIFVATLDFIAFPLLWFWRKIGPRTLAHRTGLLLITLVLLFWWGFLTVYSFLSLHLDNLQLRWIAFAYIWEVVSVGGFTAYLIVRWVRFADLFLHQNVREDKTNFLRIHERITQLPARSAIFFAAMVALGYAIGSWQLYYFAKFPFAEVFKSLVSGVITGTLGSFFIFFGLERIIKPAARKSALLSGAVFGAGFQPRKPRLFKKVYIISSILVVASTVFLWQVAHNYAQTMLENELRLRLERELAQFAVSLQKTGRLPKAADYRKLLGPGGELELVPVPAEYNNQTWIERSGAPRIRGFRRIDDSTALMAVMNLSDFDDGLTRFSQASAAVFLMIMFLGAGVSFYFSRSLTEPLQELKEAGLRLSRRNFVEPVVIYTNDEIEEVGSAMNEAQRQLSLSWADLEAEIDDRTKRLQESYKALEEAKEVLEVRVEARTHELKELAQSLEEKVKERTKELQERLFELERFQRLTVGREMKMVELKRKIKELEKELEKKGRR